jgi:two-component sensor histidine kinase
LLELQSIHVKDKNIINILKESQERVKSMAIVHEKLYGSKDFTKINFKMYIKELSIHLFNSFDAHNIKLKVEGDDLFLDLETAIPCGLIINELITNSIKYAFPANYIRGPANAKFADPTAYSHVPENGKFSNSSRECLEITTDLFESPYKDEYTNSPNLKDEICVNLSSNRNEITIKVSDNGIGIPDDKKLENNGTLGFLIITTLVNQIKGNIKMINRKGTTFEIKLPNKL